MKLFESFKIKDMALKNRIVMPPMCMYQATSDGFPTLFHIGHYAARALGGAGLIIVESTGVTPEGRITDRDLGIWDDRQISGLKRIVDIIHSNGAKAALQINHAGRKSTSASGHPLGPSAIPFDSKSRAPSEMTRQQILNITAAFKDAAVRANAAGFDALEIHGAHGYLIHEFLSPLTNKREDEYGGSLENRLLFLQNILKEVQSVWPSEKPLWLRVSASDYQKGGIDGDMMVRMIDQIKPFVDLIHVSSGGLLPVKIDDYPGYQVALAEKIRKQCGIATIAVGLITNEEMAEEILQNGRADLVALGRELLRNPYWPVHTAVAHKIGGYIPESYLRAYPKM
ncbi:MAG TPA: NADPH dehydrogenase NamA [Clostridia bacterium]|nr:NADPH dehydrogenase NamA [Clostridia bacterium]